MSRIFSNCQKFSKENKTIDLVGYQLDGGIHFEVRDRGIGFDEKRMRESVDVFGQLDRDKLEQQGSGLGLAIASRYAKINGGKLEFTERKGGGAIVALTLPIFNPNPQTPGA
jgi:K+-sensing histidine kinase KdpD